MKYILFICVAAISQLAVVAQEYPVPEFSGEVYQLQKGTVQKVTRLEKNHSAMETKTKMGGFGGSETAYLMEGEKSAVRFSSSDANSFVYTAEENNSPSAMSDSLMKANGMDPAKFKGFGSNDPASLITLYKAETGKGERKVLLQKGGGMVGGKKMRSSPKFTFSVKKVKDGYWELIVDKPLSAGEYVFTMMGTGMSGMNGDMTMFAFAVD